MIQHFEKKKLYREIFCRFNQVAQIHLFNRILPLEAHIEFLHTDENVFVNGFRLDSFQSKIQQE